MKCWAHQHEDRQLTRKHLTFLSIFKVIQTAPPQPNHCCHPEAIMSGKMNGWLHCTHTIQLPVNSVSQSKTDQHTTGVMFVPHSWDVERRKTDGRSTGGTLLLNFYLCCNCVPGQSEIRHEFSNGYWGYLGLTPQCCCWWKVLLVTIFDEIL